jgi:pyruvate dehydrogenase E2 component (dihydrolipoamide acetyltransferase)
MSVTKVVLAKLSPTMEEGTIVKWNKQEGDAVKVGDVLAEIETDKANMEMEALGEGILRKVLVGAGGKAPVGALIGVIAGKDEDISAMLASAAATASAPTAPAAPTPAAPAPAVVPPVPSAAPVAAPAAAPSPFAPAAMASSVPAPSHAVPVAAPLAAASAPATVPAPSGDGRVKASPLARAMAARKNISLHTIAGSGPGGRIVKRDLEGLEGGAPAAVVAPPTVVPSVGPTAVAVVGAAPVPATVVPFPAPAPGQTVALSNMRKTIARRLSESMFTAPHFYVTIDIDMGQAVIVREQLIAGEQVKVSFNDLVVKACAKALAKFPLVNSSFTPEAIVTHAEVHVGVAVAVPDGLIVPVVRNADRKTVAEISREVKDLATRAREKKLRPEEFMGSTFSISNLGMMDVTEFTAIINPPESAILAVGAVRKEPVVTEDRIEVGHRMKVTLSSDHRVIDGALAASFLAEVRRLLEHPVSLFL